MNNQKEKQRSFQESPLPANGTSLNLSSQAPIYWGATSSSSSSLSDPELYRRMTKGQGGNPNGN